MVRIIIFLLTVGLTFSMSAQSTSFRVLAVSGANQYSEGGAAWKPLKVGVKLSGNSKIKTADGSYVGLIHQTGKTFEIKKAGVYDLKKINDKAVASAGSTELSDKYAEFVVNKLSESDNEDINKNKERYMNVTGAVKRADDQILVLMPELSEAYGPEVNFTWTSMPDLNNSSYLVEVKNIYDEVLKKEAVQDTSFTLSFDEAPFNESKMLLINVSVDGRPMVTSNKVGIKKLEEDRRSEIEPELKKLKESLSEDNALDMLILGTFFEEHGLRVDALSAYHKAVELAPDVEVFRNTYLMYAASAE
ncbi:hypothetical protein OO013_14575 [Mangrovivirga sp. M17]|uniref:Tetratricopeptide repeat protein n=1 Tax=Mangrovivirga halotolerans TaxID=2993936 RepID=A0ABT3RV35_9BACT|nr:hypothetical protein [Mangrovivirga halotolerans]MCX2745102.1 hypothetical protein [Mangrovivirga halotolerans]